MAQTDTLRPVSTYQNGDNTVVPSGTRHGVTSDNSDSTYISWSDTGATPTHFGVLVGSHTPPANHQRHQIRVRARGRSNDPTFPPTSGHVDLGRTGNVWIINKYFNDGTVLEDITSAWSSNTGFGLERSGAIADITVEGAASGFDTARWVELYVDIDCRQRPTYTPDVLDAAGVSQGGGTVTDTNRPTLAFGGVTYDSLPPLDWEVTVGGQTFSGAGTPPTSLQTDPLDNGLYEAEFTVRSTIRGVDPFEHTQSVSFEIANPVPPPPPPANLTATVVEGGIQVCWEDPGGQPWDDNFVYANVYRSDCVNPDDLGLTLPGEVGAYAYMLDTTSTSVTGDVDLAAELTHQTWRPEVVSGIVTKHTSTGNQRSYSLALTSSGELEFGWSTDGTSANRTVVLSTVAVPFGQYRQAVRATLDVNNGASGRTITFYTADSIDGPWIQLGDAVTQAGTTSIFNSTARLEVGSFSAGTQFPLDAVVYRVQVRSGIGGTLVADPNFVDTLPGQTELVDSVGNLWTIAGGAQLQAVPERLIAVIEDGLTACYTDYTVPTVNGSPGCDPVSCPVSYRVEYVGTVSEIVEQPSNIPSGFIVGWPSTVGSIPSGWSRVTALDGLFPRGSAATTSGATGGTSSHSHTTPGHTHHINSHTHTVGGSTGTSNSNTTSARFNGASQAQADQPHSHTRAANTGSGGAATSGSASPATDSANNLPAHRTVIWIQSNGSPTAFTAGMLAYSAESVAGWADDASSSGRYLRGAGTGANGGSNAGSNTHSHTVAAHTHTGANHSHSLGNTGLSNPLSTIEAGDGSSQPEWLPRHTHPQTVGSQSTNNLDSTDGGPTDSVSLEPPNRRLRVLANLAGGLQTRMIGLFRGNAGTLPATMVRCDGTSGTPDMRDWFARERGADSLGTTGGTTTHTHTTGNHSHTIPVHSHTTSVGASQTNSLERPSFGDLGDSPTVGHTHTSGNTGSTASTTQTSTSGTTGSANHVPQYEDVHFVRLEGVSTVTGVAIPQIITSEIAEITIEAPTAFSDLLATESGSLEICPDSSYDLPRLQQRATPLVGGIPQVSTTTHGRHRRLEFPVRDADVPAAEALLAMEYVWYAPLTEPAAWYAPSGWSVRPAAPGIKTFSVTLVRKDPPALTPGEELL